MEDNTITTKPQEALKEAPPVSLATVSCVDIEVAIMTEFDFRQNLIVPNISNQMGLVAFETDMLVLTKSGYAHGFEIKVSKSDLKADFKKRHHVNFNLEKNGKVGLERFYAKFKYFSYAVPEQLKDCALELVPDLSNGCKYNPDHEADKESMALRWREYQHILIKAIALYRETEIPNEEY